MASVWKKILEKGNQLPKEDAQAADWEAMHSKIVAHPDLNAPKRGLSFLPIILIGLILLTVTGLGVGYMWYSTAQKQETNTKLKSTKIPTTSSLPALELPDESNVSNTSNTNIPKEEKEALKSELDNDSEPINEQQSLTKRKSAQAPIEKSLTNEASTQVGVSSSKQPMAAVPSNHTTLKEDESTRILSGKSIHKISVASIPTAKKIEEPIRESAEEELGLDIDQRSKVATAAKTVGLLKEEAQTDQNILTPEVKHEMKNHETKTSQENNGAPQKPTESTVSVKSTEGEIEEFAQEQDTIGSLDETLAEEAASTQVPMVNSPSFTEMGFKISSLNVNGLLLTNFKEGFIGYGGGIDVDWSSRKWLINTGLYAYQLQYDPFLTGSFDPTGFDTSYTTTVTQRDVIVGVDSVWVVLGPNQGGYVYDSIINTIKDSVKVADIDTAAVNLVQQISYVEMPILLGRRFQFNRYMFDIYGGALLNQLIQTGSGETPTKQSLGIDILFQPSIGYQLSENWSLKARVGLRYSLLNQDFRKQQFSNNFQLGVSYSW